jgi:hypothetical protein
MKRDDFEPTYVMEAEVRRSEWRSQQGRFDGREDDGLNAARGIVIAAALSLAVWCVGATLVVLVAVHG